MRLAYLSADLPHLQFTTNRLARGMSKPTVGHWNRLKRAARYVKQHSRWTQIFEMKIPVRSIDAFTDSDWAGDATDRKSVSCAVIMMGKHLIKFSVATQSKWRGGVCSECERGQYGTRDKVDGKGFWTRSCH
eukprot:2857170-Amphidinium_carterae.1